MEELIKVLTDLVCVLAIICGTALGMLITFYILKLANWFNNYEQKKKKQQQELNKLTQADKDDLMFYIRQEMRNFSYDLKKEEKDKTKEKK